MTQITPEDLKLAVDDLAMMPFFPVESRSSVMVLLGRMCPHREALRWLVSECINKVDKWPGPKELRGILCCKYDALDGQDVVCSLPGYSPSDNEAKYLARQHEQIKSGGYLADESRALIRQILKR